MKETKVDKVLSRVMIFLINFMFVFAFVMMLCSVLKIDPRERTGNIFGVCIYLNMFVSWITIKIGEIHEALLPEEKDEIVSEEQTF